MYLRWLRLLSLRLRSYAYGSSVYYFHRFGSYKGFHKFGFAEIDIAKFQRKVVFARSQASVYFESGDTVIATTSVESSSK